MFRSVLLAAWLSAWAALAASAAELTVTIEGARNPSGAVAVALFNGEDGFPRAARALASARIRAAAHGKASFTFHNLAPGKYAVSAFHDENDNGKLDTDVVGFPTEGFGFSNDARGTLGPPTFAKAAFELGDERKSVTVTLAY